MTLQRGFLDEEATERQAKKSADAGISDAERGGEKEEIISAAEARVREKQGGYVSVAMWRGVSFLKETRGSPVGSAHAQCDK